MTVLAKKAPWRSAPTVSSSFALGAQTIASTFELRENFTLVPFAMIRRSQAVALDDSGPTSVPFENLIDPMTRIVTLPRASRRARRCSVRLQKVYVPAVRMRVPRPAPPPAISTAPYVPSFRISV